MTPPTLATSLSVHLWTTALDATDAQRATIRPLLDDGEQSRAEAFHHGRDRRRFVTARGFLRRVLGLHMDVDPASIRFREGDGIKPRVVHPAPGASLGFNLSRSGDLAMCAIAADREIGVDIERVRPLDDLEQLARSVLSHDEQVWWDAIDPADRLASFYDIWTRKEAVGKAEGHGIAPGPKSIRVPLGPIAPDRWVAATGTADTSRWLLSVMRPCDDFVGCVVVASPPGAGRTGRCADEGPVDAQPLLGVHATRMVRRLDVPADGTR